MSRSHALGTWGDFKNHILVNRMSQTLWRDLQRLELVLFCSMVSKNNTDEKRRHKRLFLLIFVISQVHFAKCKGKFLQQRAATRNGAAQGESYLGRGDVGDGVGRDVSGVDRLGSGACSWALRAFSLVMLSCPRKVRNGNCERGCEGKLIPKKLGLSG